MFELQNTLERKSFRFVYFDLGGVVFSFSGGLEKLAKLLSIPLGQVKKYWKFHDNQICSGELSPQDFWLQLAKKYNFPNSSSLDFIDLWTDHFSPILEVHSLINQLSTENIPVGILTNIYPTTWEKALKKNHIPNIQYHAVIKSCDIGLIKPNLKIYKHATMLSGCKPEEILFIDDRQENIDSAKKLEWQTILFENSR